MGLFTQGQLVCLKSDPSIEGAVISIIEGGREIRYQVFTNVYGVQIYYESQIATKNLDSQLEVVDAEYFHAGITASLIRTPSLSSLYSLNMAKIDFIPHQFRPVLKFIRSDRPRLLIADGVGVGKTIEAGLILKEMQARRNVNSVLIICPRPLVSERKWENEMKRFDIELTALNGELFRYCIKETDYEGEWPDKYKKVIIPYSLFDESTVMGSNKGGRDKMGLMQLDPPPKFDLVIVDEAHHIRNTSTYAYQAVKQFCDNAEAVVFLTATPVQLEYDDLFVMLNLLRPDLIIDKETFVRMAEPNPFINHASVLVRLQREKWQEEAYEQMRAACMDTEWGRIVLAQNPVAKGVLQTLKKSNILQEERVKLISDIEGLHTFSNIISRTRRRDIGEFTLRKAVTVTVPFTSAQKQLHDEILSVIHKIFSQIHCTDNTKFMMTTIRRQTASCLFGLVPMLHEILCRHISELYDDGYMENDILSKDGKDARSIRAQIEDILNMADDIPPDDPKLDKLLEIIADKQKDRKNKIMIFSTFKHTLQYLYVECLKANLRVGLIHGGVSDEDRVELRRRFELDKENSDALDILLFSEVGCEGLDYQFCDCMINYDLPWNPMRIEQRIGRIDRNGQTSESVTIFNMITPGTVDYDIYERCLNRIGVFKSSIGDCEDILGGIATEIRSIVENFKMTDEEKQEKLQQMTDNKIRLIQEQIYLEEKQRDLFGIKVPDQSFNEEIKKATNTWLSSEYIQNLIHSYLKNRLESDKEYILGEKSLKTLRLSQSARLELLDDFKECKLPRNEHNRQWEKWLKSGETHLSITFDHFCAKENPKAAFITVGHPLVRQAAEYMKTKKKFVSVFKVCTNQYRKGEYPFAIFQWKLSGEHEDLQLRPFSIHSELNDCLLDLLKESHSISYPVSTNIAEWDSVEHVHHTMWEQELKMHRAKTEELVRYKIGSLTTSHNARMAMLKEQLLRATDGKIRLMKESEIRNAQEDYEMHLSSLQNANEKADILFDILAYGLLIVESKEE